MSLRNLSRFIPGEEIDAVKQWSFAAVDLSAPLLAAAEPESIDLEAQQRQEELARQEAYAQGFSQGHAQATLDGQQRITAFIADHTQEQARIFGNLFAQARAQLEQAEQVIARGTLELACELARQVLRHELSVNPNALQPVLREALGLLVGHSKSAVVRLHPLDMEVLDEVVRTEFADLSLSLMADPAITRGGCLVESAGSVLDGSLEKRWLRAVANLGLTLNWEEAHDASPAAQ